MKLILRIKATLLFITLLPSVVYAQGLTANFKQGLSYELPRGVIQFKLGGRLQLDGALFDEDKTTLKNDYIVRRARISLRTDFFHDWRFSLEYDLVDEEERYESLWLRYSGFENTYIKLGQFQEPFGLENSTSSKNIVFMERSLANALVPGTNVGLALQHWGKQWGVTSGMFWETYIEDADPFAKHESKGFSTRITGALLQKKRSLFHMGISGSYRLPDSRERVRYRSRPESGVTDERLISTGRIKHIRHSVNTGIEAILSTGTFTLQGEYLQTIVYRKDDRRKENFDGAYLSVSFFPLNGQRRYSIRGGTFGAVKSTSWKVWEIALRWSYLDFNGTKVNKGIERNLTWGINWYPYQNVRFMLNYIQVDTDAAAGNDDPRILQVRSQLAF